MPLYEYKCHVCGKVFEALQKFSDEPLTTHATCGGAVEKLISAPAFHLKGTGWYVTDYAKGSGASPKAEEGKSEAKADGKSESKSETKAESKPADSSTPAPAAESKPTPATTGTSTG